MKDGLAKPALQRLAANLARAHATFDQTRFVSDCLRGLGKLELKQRVTHVIAVLHRHLPPSFAEASAILRAAAETWDRGDPSDSLRGFAAWPVIDYVGVYGLNEPAEGLETLRHLTGLFTAEFAIRPFLEADPLGTLATIEGWLSDEDAAVRRLCSEGIRPLLPWGKRVRYLSDNPTVIISVLDRLVYDSNEDVRRSVANNLNDIAKQHPALAVRTCRRWLDQAPRPLLAQTDRVVRHATRSLVKAGNVEALTLHGATASAVIQVVRFELAPSVLELGGRLQLTAELHSAAAHTQRLVVDYAIHHQLAKQTSRAKVFKWKVLDLNAGQGLVLVKVHPVRPITTRKYYPGEHAVELLVNGNSVARGEFLLRIPN